MQINVKCPNCSHTNKVTIDADRNVFAPKVILCELEEGGCDAYFAFTTKIPAEVKTYKIQSE